jgi:hypothetical protein
MAAKRLLPAHEFDALCRPQHMDTLRSYGVDVLEAEAVYAVFLTAAEDCFDAFAATVSMFFERAPEQITDGVRVTPRPTRDWKFWKQRGA